jgi:multidrug transporter EmrE-like cation transporter
MTRPAAAWWCLAAASAAIGILWFREPATALKLASPAPVMAGIVGLNLSSPR